MVEYYHTLIQLF